MTPSGLEVAINLTDGQKIPNSGYLIKVTPLNGQGKSFQKVEIYVGDQLVNTSTPDGLGEVNWFWNPGASLANTDQIIKIIVYDTDGVATTQIFTIHLVDDALADNALTPGTGTKPNQDKEGGIVSRTVDAIGKSISGAAQTAEKLIAQLPTPLVYTIPYLIFVLLGISILITFIQQRRELRELAMLRSLTEQQQGMVSAKESFLRLSAHYLRTPLAIMEGGVGLIAISKTEAITPAVSASAASLKSTLAQLKQSIEQLLQRASASLATVAEPLGRPRVFTRPSFWLPLALSLLLSVGFTYLAVRADALQPSFIRALTQIAIYILLGIMLYSLCRHLYLYRTDRKAVQEQHNQWSQLATTQDEIFDQDSADLQLATQDIAATLATLPASQSSSIITKGYTSFHEVLRKILIANHLRGASSTEPLQVVQLHQLIDNIQANLSAKLQAKQIQLAIDDGPLAVRQPELLSYALRTVLDNAISYSAATGVIAVTLQTNDTLDRHIIKITDHGAGIPAEKLENLFRPFERVEDAMQFDREGMGFSLYLDQLIMTYLGGSIAATSDASGTTITLELPSPGTTTIV